MRLLYELCQDWLGWLYLTDSEWHRGIQLSLDLSSRQDLPGTEHDQRPFDFASHLVQTGCGQRWPLLGEDNR